MKKIINGTKLFCTNLFFEISERGNIKLLTPLLHLRRRNQNITNFVYHFDGFDTIFRFFYLPSVIYVLCTQTSGCRVILC